MARDTNARNTARKARSIAEYATRDITPFFPKDFSGFVMLHDTATTASSVFATPVTVDCSRAKRATVFVQSNNAGTLIVSYSVDGGQTFLSKTVTPTQDPATNKQTYSLTIEAPLSFIKYSYTETAAVGYLYGGVSTVESVVL